MGRRFFLALGMVLSPTVQADELQLPGGPEIRMNGLLVARVANKTQSDVSYTIYAVSNGPAFLALTLPLGQIVLWNGLTLLPGIQYDAGTLGITLRNLPLNVGDYITVISPIAVAASKE